MKNAQTLKTVILVMTLGALLSTALNASEKMTAYNDTTDVQYIPLEKQLNYSLMTSFLDELEFISEPEKNSSFTQQPTLFLNSPAQSAPGTPKPTVDLSKFHKDDSLNKMQYSIQKNLGELQNTQLMYRDYFKIPINIYK